MGTGIFLLTSREFLSTVEVSRTKEDVLRAIEGHVVVEDCARVLKNLPDNSVDLIHTSPPYNIDKRYLQGLADRTDLAEYTSILAESITELKRVLRPGGSLFWQTGYTQLDGASGGDILPIDIVTYSYFRDLPVKMLLWDRIIWRYWGGHAFKRKLTNKHETILWFVKPGQEPLFLLDEIREQSKEYDKRNNFLGRNPGNVWEVDRVAYGSTEQTSHIAVFPEAVSEKIIRACSRPGDLVLDPFCGSGTAPKVARSLGRRWIGVEISPVYAKEAAIRIGYQQPSETESLVSELIKHIAFHRRNGTLPIEEIVRRLKVWVRPLTLETLAVKFESDAAGAIADKSRSKSVKRAVWMEYDQKISNESPEDQVVLTDSLLVRTYKNRRNQNGVSRYRSALDLLGRVTPQLSQPDRSLGDYIRAIVSQEPSSFALDNDLVSLKSTQRRIQTQALGFDDERVNLEGANGPNDLEEVRQGRLPL
jgi:adenine-specific DNA-methyltransferase